MKKFTIIVWLSFLGTNLYSENHYEEQIKIKNHLEKVIENRRDRHTMVMPFDKSLLYSSKTIPLIKEHLDDPSQPVRSFLYYCLQNIAQKQEDKEIKKEILEVLVVKFTKDLSNQKQISEIIRRFNRNLLNESMKNMITQGLNSNDYNHFLITVNLIAQMNIRDAIPKFKEFLKTKEIDKRKRYFLERALARMGDLKMMDKCVEHLLECNPTDSGRIAYVLPEMAFIRQPKTIEYIAEFLVDDKTVEGCEMKLKYGHYALRDLKKCVMDLPIKEGCYYSDEEIRRCQKWMTDKYTPYLIKSYSVNIDGKIVDNLEKKKYKSKVEQQK